MTAEPSSPGRRPTTIVAFTSHTGGIGRTGVVANLAMILCIADQRVLVVDSGPADPRVHEYLLPFHAETPPVDQLLGVELAQRLAPPEPAGRVPVQPDVSRLAARQYRFPGGSGCIDVVTTNPLAPLGRLSSVEEDNGDGLALRDRIRATGYDYVLIDGPTDASASVVTRLARLCDVVAVCFTPQRTSTARAAQLAQRIGTSAKVGPRIIAVPLQFDDQDHDRAQQTRTMIRDAFVDQLLNADAPSGPELQAAVVEIPYQPRDDLFDHALVPLLDEPERLSSVSSAYGQLAHVITQGVVNQVPAIPPGPRRQYRFALELEPEDAQPTVFLLYAPSDRRWADWVRVQMERCGARVARLPDNEEWRDEVACPQVVVVASRHLAGSSAGARGSGLAREVAQNSPQAAAFNLVVVAVSDEPIAAPLAEVPQISLARCAEPPARTRLLSHFVMVDRAPVDQAPVVFFPGGPGATGSMSNVPPRNLEFVGRSDELEAMRDHFVVAGGPRIWTLTGAIGIGKSEIAKEYGHRFALDYDLAWWIPADSRVSVRASLAELGARMELPATDGMERAVLDALAAGEPYSRWLLIYDNADHDNALAGLMPAADAGHVIVTTRLPTPALAIEVSTEVSQVCPLRPDDCVAMLCNGVIDLVAEDAEKAAALVEYLPLGITLAKAWMRETAALLRRKGESREKAAAWAAVEFRTRLEQSAHSVRPAGQEPAVIPASLIATMAVVVETLQADESGGRTALRLAQLCTFMAAGGVGLRLLRSRRMLAALAPAAADRDALMGDPLELDRVLWTGTRFGLFEVGWEHPAALRMHRLVQALVRQLMAAEERLSCHAEVLQALAAFAPTDAEGKCRQDQLDFAELDKHLVPSNAAASTEFEVRHWLVDQIAYVSSEGGPESWQFAVELGDRMLAGWAPTNGVQLALRMRLEFRLLNLYRALGRPSDVLLAEGQSLLEEQRSVLGPTHPRTLKAARNPGAELRSLGRFAEARAADQAAWRGFRAVLGENHPDTLRAANNLAVSLFLAGDTPAALAQDENNRERRLALYGPDHPDVWWSASSVGRDLCELGRYEEARKVLDDAFTHIVSLRRPGHPEELRIQRNRAIVRRRAGERLRSLGRVTAAENSASLNDETLRRYRTLFGSNHPDTRACQLSFALDQHQIGHSRAAAESAEDCLRYYAQLSVDHPFAALCRTNIAVFLRAAGELERALELGLQGRDQLCGRLGEQHPWALASRINYARLVAELGEVATARDLLRSAHEDCRDFLVRDHHYTLLAADNLASEVDQWMDVGVDVPVS